MSDEYIAKHIKIDDTALNATRDVYLFNYSGIVWQDAPAAFQDLG